MDGRRWAEAREREPEPRASSSGHQVRLTSSEGLNPVLGLQATAGNAAVTALLRDTRGPNVVQRDTRGTNVQRLWDTEDEPGASETGGTDASETEGGPEASQEGGGAADPDAIDAVRSEVEADLDPAAVVGTLAPYTASGGGLGDYETPGPRGAARHVQFRRAGQMMSQTDIVADCNEIFRCTDAAQ